MFQHLSASVASWAIPEKTKLTPIKEDFLNRLHRSGAAIVTNGGSSFSTLLPGTRASAKLYFKESPASVDELVKRIADSLEPALKSLAKGDVVKSREPLILLFPAPGLTHDKKTITLPSNFGKLAGQSPNLAELVPAELSRRARVLGIPKEQLKLSFVHVDNDILPIAANIGQKYMKPGEHGVIYFVGTGTGSGKAAVDAVRGFEVRALEEGHLLLDQFPTVQKQVPDHIRLGSMIAEAKDGSSASAKLELENISGGGRVTDSLTGARSHLGGANTVALNYLFKKVEEIPQWILKKGGDTTVLKKRFMESLGFKNEEELKKLLESSPADRELFEQVKQSGSLGTFEISQAADRGSSIAEKIISDNTYSQALVGGVIALNVGQTPAGRPATAKWLFENAKNGKYNISFYPRASDGLSSWAQKYIGRARQGLNDAKNLLFQDVSYVRRLTEEGYGAVRADQVSIDLKPVVPESDLHPDFSGLDYVAEQMRNNLRRASVEP
ncbi:MAG TPA: hypothetical protein VJB59_10655 [Bdellovibrionota bacterium]|nr:hypothetical protein [Bdellovibrionota bacterium]